VKIPPDAIIPEGKLTQYLLVLQPKNDKSKFLAQAGFTLDNPADLLAAIQSIIATNEAIENRTDEYGTFYEVTGVLVAVSGIDLGVVTIWLQRQEDGNFRFVTLIPSQKPKL
jgi:hypothetical protein